MEAESSKKHQKIQLPSFLDGKFLDVDKTSTLELKNDTTIPQQSDAKILEVFSAEKFNEFIYNDGFKPANFPMMFIFIFYESATKDEHVKRQIIKKFNDNRPLILELKSCDQIYINQSGKFDVGDDFKANFMSTMDWMTPDRCNRKNFIEFLESIVSCRHDLYLRILKLYELKTAFEGNSETWDFALCMKVIEDSLDIKMLEAALDLPFNYSSHMRITRKSEELIRHVTPDNESIIKKLTTDLIAEDGRYPTLLKFMINNFKWTIDDMNFDHKMHISQIVYDKTPTSRTAKDVFFYLIEADFPFPEGFDEAVFADNPTLTDRKEFHNAITCGVEPSEIHIKNARIAYDFTNKSILIKCLESRNFEAYAYFRSNGFRGGSNEDIKLNLETLSSQERETIFSCNYSKSIKDPKMLVRTMVSISRLNNLGNYINQTADDEHYRKIEEYFSYVYDSHSCMPKVFKIVADNLTKGFQFDFLSEHVHQIHPEHVGCWGVMRAVDRCILIGALCEDEMMIKQTIAHEMMHFVIWVVYENGAKPHFYADKKRELEMEKLVVDFETVPDVCDKIVKRVYEAYDDSSRSEELIVRPIEMFMRYRNDQVKLAECKQVYNPLFKYFDVVLEDIKKFDQENHNELRNIIKDLNLGSKFHLNNCEYFAANSLKIDEVTQVLISENPTLTAIGVCHKLRKIYGSIFCSKLLIVSAETLPKIEGEYEKILERHPEARVVVLLPEKTENFSDLLKKIFIKDAIKFTIVASQGTAPLIQEFLTNKNIFYATENANLSWINLHRDVQMEILTKSIHFQNKKLNLHALARRNCLTFFDNGFLKFYYEKEDLTTNAFQLDKSEDIYFNRVIMKNYRGKLRV